MFSRFRRNAKVFESAVEALDANVMVADAELIIRYVNPSLHAFLARSEEELRRELPNFRMETLIGSNIDVFHKRPEHQRAMLSALKETHRATIWVGKTAFDLIVNPLNNGRRRIGFVVEWADANERLLNIDYREQLQAIGRSQAMITFEPDGTIIDANQNFLNIMGYTLEEIRGRKHSMFVDPSHAQSQEYRDFWRNLAEGVYQDSQYKRFGKNGKEVWLRGSYNPIRDASGRIVKVVKCAADLTDLVKFVHSFGGGLAQLAKGNLQQRLSVSLSKDLDPVRNDFNTALETLQASFRRMRTSAGTIEEAAETLRGSSDDLSARSEQQAASLEQSSAALNEVTEAVKRTGEATKHAQSVVGSAKSAAQGAAEVMTQTVQAMSSLEASSAQIGRIIGTIDEIAFQTSLLALNAGVEAARAGESGRGFAVVASEVRALAQRSAEAAKEIKTLISSSEQQVSRGVGLVGQSRGALDKIVAGVNDIDTIVGQIASSATEQALSLQHVNTAVGEMNGTTQKNAAMAQEATSTTHCLAEEAKQMMTLVNQFDTGDAKEAVVKLAPRTQSAPAPSAKPRPAVRPRKHQGEFDGNAALARTSEPEWEEF